MYPKYVLFVFQLTFRVNSVAAVIPMKSFYHTPSFVSIPFGQNKEFQSKFDNRLLCSPKQLSFSGHTRNFSNDGIGGASVATSAIKSSVVY